MFWLVVEVAAIARAEAAGAVLNAECGRALCIALKGSARYTWAWDNKSLDASGVSSSLSDNLSVTWLSPAASTPPLSRIAFLKTQNSATEPRDSLGWYGDGFTRGEAGGPGTTSKLHAARARYQSRGCALQSWAG